VASWIPAVARIVPPEARGFPGFGAPRHLVISSNRSDASLGAFERAR
jgi:hypothetical protein